MSLFSPVALCLAAAIATAAAAPADAADSPPVQLKHDEAKGEIDVSIRGEHFTTYHYGDDVRTPFLWPVHAEGQVGVTRNYPMAADEPESTDHSHHRSLYFAFGDVNGYDHWHKETIRTRSVETQAGAGYGSIRAHNEWITPAGEPLLEEIQEIRFPDTPAAARFFEFVSTLTAVQDVTFGDNKEGLLAVRIRPEIQGNRAGFLTNAEGEQGEKNVYGTPSPWMDYSGLIERHGIRGITIFDHPSNLRHPVAWHVRDYGLAAANPFGMRSVAGKAQEGSYVLKRGASITFVYGIYVHSGDVHQAGVAQKYRDFAKGAGRVP